MKSIEGKCNKETTYTQVWIWLKGTYKGWWSTQAHDSGGDDTTLKPEGPSGRSTTQSQEGAGGVVATGEGFSTGAMASSRGNCGLARAGARGLSALTHLLPSDFLLGLSIGRTWPEARRPGVCWCRPCKLGSTAPCARVETRSQVASTDYWGPAGGMAF